VNKYLDIAVLDENNIPLGTAHHYRELKIHASGCVECGSCEERCPFGVPVIENMQRATKVFGI
jgi:predicted aldo/keto reductase-like oxidoreductase